MSDNYRTTVIRVEPEIYEALQKLRKESNRTINDIASMGLAYALKHVKMVPVTAYDISFGDGKKAGE